MIIMIIIADYGLFIANFWVETLKTKVYIWSDGLIIITIGSFSLLFSYFFLFWHMSLMPRRCTVHLILWLFHVNCIERNKHLQTAKSRMNKWYNAQYHDIPNEQISSLLSEFSTRIGLLGRYYIVRNENKMITNRTRTDNNSNNNNNCNNEGSHPEINRESTEFFFSLLFL